MLLAAVLVQRGANDDDINDNSSVVLATIPNVLNILTTTL